MPRRYFGPRQFGTLYGVMFAIAILGNAAGSNLLGWSFQIFLQSAVHMATRCSQCCILDFEDQSR
jgi:hypothetical protein